MFDIKGPDHGEWSTLPDYRSWPRERETYCSKGWKEGDILYYQCPADKTLITWPSAIRVLAFPFSLPLLFRITDYLRVASEDAGDLRNRRNMVEGDEISSPACERNAVAEHVWVATRAGLCQSHPGLHAKSSAKPQSRTRLQDGYLNKVLADFIQKLAATCDLIILAKSWGKEVTETSWRLVEVLDWEKIKEVFSSSPRLPAFGYVTEKKSPEKTKSFISIRWIMSLIPMIKFRVAHRYRFYVTHPV